MFVLRRIAFVFLIAVPAAAAPQDATPPGMVAFFTSHGCPAGWMIATSARGRLIVAAKDAAGNGIQVGTPLSSATPPTHNHKYVASFDLPKLGIAAGWGGNNTGGKARKYETGTEWANSSNGDLPYVQLTICQKQ